MDPAATCANCSRSMTTAAPASATTVLHVSWVDPEPVSIFSAKCCSSASCVVSETQGGVTGDPFPSPAKIGVDANGTAWSTFATFDTLGIFPGSTINFAYVMVYPVGDTGGGLGSLDNTIQVLAVSEVFFFLCARGCLFVVVETACC